MTERESMTIADRPPKEVTSWRPKAIRFSSQEFGHVCPYKQVTAAPNNMKEYHHFNNSNEMYTRDISPLFFVRNRNGERKKLFPPPPLCNYWAATGHPPTRRRTNVFTPTTLSARIVDSSSSVKRRIGSDRGGIRWPLLLWLLDRYFVSLSHFHSN